MFEQLSSIRQLFSANLDTSTINSILKWNGLSCISILEALKKLTCKTESLQQTKVNQHLPCISNKPQLHWFCGYKPPSTSFWRKDTTKEGLVTIIWGDWPHFLQRNNAQINVAYWTIFQFFICNFIINALPANCIKFCGINLSGHPWSILNKYKFHITMSMRIEKNHEAWLLTV